MSDDGSNALLRTMTPDDAALLVPGLEPVELPLRYLMERPQARIRHIYFPDSGVASIVSMANRNKRIEAGVFGREGMSGLAVLLGADRSPNETFIQVPGHGRRIATEDLLQACERSPTLRVHLLRLAHAMLVQTMHTALANGQAKIEERLARWLLMCHDRVDGDDLPLTHEFLSLMLGVRRAGVTVALAALEQKGLVRPYRGGSAVLDREGLEKLADGIYGVPEAEYRRLYGTVGLRLAWSAEGESRES